MIKQNIKIAIVTIICFLTLWLVTFNFIKIDRTSQATLSFAETIPTISIDNETSAYIQKHDKRVIQVEFNKQYFKCNITFMQYAQDYSVYSIFVPPELYQSQQYMVTNIIVDSQNLYQYWFKK